MLFSIGIPAFKAKFLKECINSILEQTYTNFELIIVNDASPENVDEIVASFSDSRIQYFKNDENIGAENVVDNWNKCLSYAKGDYFILMGDDDKMENNYLEEFIKLIGEYPQLDVYHCRSYIINEKSEKIEISPSWPNYETVYENIWHRISVKRLQFISDFVYKTSTLKNNNGFFKQPLAWVSDDITSYIAAGDKGIAHTNIPIFCYRRNSSTISNTGNIELKLKAIKKENEWIINNLKNRSRSLNDELIYKNIINYLPKYYKKKRVFTITNYMKLGFFRGMWKIIKIKDFSFLEKSYAILTYYKSI